MLVRCHLSSHPQLHTPQTGFLPPPPAVPFFVPYPVLRSHAQTQPSRAHVASTSGVPGDQFISVTARVWACKTCSMWDVAKEGEKDKL